MKNTVGRPTIDKAMNVGGLTYKQVPHNETYHEFMCDLHGSEHRLTQEFDILFSW